MNKKIMLLSVLALYLSCTLASPAVLAESTSTGLGLFSSEIAFDFTPIGEPIATNHTQEVKINVKYKLDMGSLAKWFFFKRRIGRLMLFGPGYILKLRGYPQATVNLSITGCPEWCTAQLDTSTLSFDYDNAYTEKTVKLSFSINDSAPALETGDITISAEYPGNNWTIKSTTNSTTVSIQPAYEPNLTIDAGTEFTVLPLQNTTIPINITNNGNGNSTISIQATEPENWNVSLDQEKITLGVNETKPVVLTVNPVEGFTNQTINLTFTPKSKAGDYTGSPVVLSIDVLNKASTSEEGEIDLGTILVIVLVVVIILILAIYVVYLFRKKKQ